MEAASVGDVLPRNIESLLDDALKFDVNNSSSTLVDELMSLRQSDNPVAAEDFLQGILSILDSNRKHIIPLSTRFSRRARLASLDRVLKLSTPSADGDSDDDDEGAAGRRRRRALAVLLRTLAKESDTSDTGGKRKFCVSRRPRIRIIEKAAVRDAKEGSALEDMNSRLPQGLETPRYDVIVRRPRSRGGYEIRSYDAFTLCTVSMKSNIKANDENRKKTDQKVSMPQLSGASSFGALAGYLFGKNSEETAMKMTTPVLTTNPEIDAAGSDEGNEGVGQQKEMSFVLPSTYWSEDGTERAPQPLGGSGVRLQRDEGGKRAALMFGGFASKADVEEKKSKLLASLEEDGDYMIEEGATTTLAQYNDPFTPPWKRLNEVSVPVVPRNS